MSTPRQDWNDVDERMPVKEGRYLTYCYGRNMHISLFSRANATSDGKNPTFSQAVTHWMELPEAPQ